MDQVGQVEALNYQTLGQVDQEEPAPILILEMENLIFQ